jgi:glyoxylase-like metal-dependent hydrolase (beta-lactamase superfamily II)
MSPHPAARPTDADLVRARHSLGDFDLTVCTDGTYLLDGGAMFGVVPKPLWSQRMPADPQNRILLGLNSVIVRTGKHTVVIETGVGNKQPEKITAFNGAQSLLMDSYAAAGLDPASVDIVINSHLHYDHCGWNTTLHPDGSVTPTFPNARYFAHQGEVDHGRLQLERDRVSYLAYNYEPLLASGQMTLLSTPLGHTEEIIPGISVERYPGHTATMLGIHIHPPTQLSCAAAPHAVYVSDLIPTANHLDSTWVMGYDLDPLTCIEQRKRFYTRAIPEQWLVLFTHDHHTPAARIALNDKGKPVPHSV